MSSSLLTEEEHEAVPHDHKSHKSDHYQHDTVDIERHVFSVVRAVYSCTCTSGGIVLVVLLPWLVVAVVAVVLGGLGLVSSLSPVRRRPPRQTIVVVLHCGGCR